MFSFVTTVIKNSKLAAQVCPLLAFIHLHWRESRTKDKCCDIPSSTQPWSYERIVGLKYVYFIIIISFLLQKLHALRQSTECLVHCIMLLVIGWSFAPPAVMHSD